MSTQIVACVAVLALVAVSSATLTGYPRVQFPQCSTAAANTPCNADPGPDVGTKDMYPTLWGINWERERNNGSPLYGITTGNGTHSIVIVSNGNGVAAYAAKGGSVPQFLWQYTSWCEMIVPVGVVGDTVITVTGGSLRCACPPQTMTCPMPGLQFFYNESTSAIVPIRELKHEAPVPIRLPQILDTYWVLVTNPEGKHIACTSNYTGNVTGVYAAIDFLLSDCEPYDYVPVLQADGAAGVIVYNLDGFGENWIQSESSGLIPTALPHFEIGLPLKADIEGLLAKGPVRIRLGGNLTSPYPLFPGDSPKGVATFSLSQVLAGGAVSFQPNTNFFTTCFNAALESALGGTRPYLWVNHWGNKSVDGGIRVTLLDMTTPSSPVAKPHGFDVSDFISMGTLKFMTLGNTHILCGILDQHPNVTTFLLENADLWVYNVTDVTSPTIIHKFALDDSTNNEALVTIGQTIFAANGSLSGIVSWITMNTDATVAAQGSFSVAGLSGQRIEALATDGVHLFVAMGESGLTAFDVTQPSAPVSLGNIGSIALATGENDGLTYVPLTVGSGSGPVSFGVSWKASDTDYDTVSQVELLPFSVSPNAVSTTGATTASSTTGSSSTGSASTTASTASTSSSTSTSGRVTTTGGSTTTTSGSATTTGVERFHEIILTYPETANVQLKDVRALVTRANGNPDIFVIAILAANGGKQIVTLTVPADELTVEAARALNDAIAKDEAFKTAGGKSRLLLNQTPSSASSLYFLSVLTVLFAWLIV